MLPEDLFKKIANSEKNIYARSTIHMGQNDLTHVTFFRDSRHSNQTSEVSKCCNVLFIFFDFCFFRVLSKTEEITEKYCLIKKICQEQKI
jgi:hypothetical protein